MHTFTFATCDTVALKTLLSAPTPSVLTNLMRQTLGDAIAKRGMAAAIDGKKQYKMKLRPEYAYTLWRAIGHVHAFIYLVRDVPQKLGITF